MKEIVESVKVYIRQRPCLSTDSPMAQEAVLPTDTAVVSGISGIGPNHKTCQYFTAQTKSKTQFMMDRFFDSHAIQDELYQEVAKPIVETSIQGYSGLILAYGPTSSGKTFTMRGGTAERRGIMPRCLEQLLQARSENGNIEIWASYLQIYCENITDLLQSTANGNNGNNNNGNDMLEGGGGNGNNYLSIREKGDGSGIVYVEGLSKYRVNSLEELDELLARGDENRSTAATNMNEFSSRSHAALMLSIIIPDDAGSSGSEARTYKEGQLVLVDLAGSERAKASEGRDYMRLEEAKAINLSLSALGNCMNALAEGRSHIPYRDSKLTRLLQNCLGGTARTAVVVTVLPGADHTGETLNALRFASRASKVKVLAKVSQYRNYEALYKESIQKLKSLEHLQVQRNEFVSIEEVKKRDDVIDKQNMELEMLRQQVLALQRENEVLRSSSSKTVASSSSVTIGSINMLDGTSGKGISTNASTSRSTAMSEDEWKDKIDKLTRDHLQVMDSMNRNYQLKFNDYKQQIKSLNQDVINAQVDLKEERERHLKTVQDLRMVKEGQNRNSGELKSRIDELLEESIHKQNLIDDARGILEGIMNAKVKAENELAMLRDEMSTMVSQEKMKEMEGLFMDTINRLADRVKNLEKPRSAGTMAPNTSKSTDAGGRMLVNSFWQPAKGQALYSPDDAESIKTSNSVNGGDRSVKIEPGGRIRANNTSATAAGSGRNSFSGPSTGSNNSKSSSSMQYSTSSHNV